MTVGTPVVVDPRSGAADLAALIEEAGLAPLPAARLALAAVEVIGAGRGGTIEVVALRTPGMAANSSSTFSNKARLCSGL